jgi:predicted nuclease with TOPRIM domain
VIEDSEAEELRKLIEGLQERVQGLEELPARVRDLEEKLKRYALQDDLTRLGSYHTHALTEAVRRLEGKIERLSKPLSGSAPHDHKP